MQVLQIQFGGFDQPVRIALRDDPNVQFFVRNLLNLRRPADEINKFGNSTWANCIPPFLAAAQEARQRFGFDWDLDNLTRANFHLWHRDIETFDIAQHPQDQQANELFFVGLHHLLHRAEGFVCVPQSGVTMLQLKWYEPPVAWPTQPDYDCYEWQPGDVTVDYPYVGKSPLISMRSQDNSHLSQSCRVPDACAPGFVIRFNQGGQSRSTIQAALSAWYDTHQDQLAQSFSKAKMLHYAGEFRVGTMMDLAQIPQLAQAELVSAELIQ